MGLKEVRMKDLKYYTTRNFLVFTVRLIQSGLLNLRWAGHTVRIEKGRSALKIVTDKLT